MIYKLHDNKKINIKNTLDSIRQSARYRNSVIWNIQDITEKIKNIDSCTTVVYGTNGIKKSVKSNITEYSAITLIEKYREQYEEYCGDLLILDAGIRCAEKFLDSCREKGVISQTEYAITSMFYIGGAGLKTISGELYYCLDWIQEVKCRALKKIQKAVNKAEILPSELIKAEDEERDNEDEDTM